MAPKREKSKKGKNLGSALAPVVPAIEDDISPEDDAELEAIFAQESGSKSIREVVAEERRRFANDTTWERNPVKAIRNFCLQCYGGSRNEVVSCASTSCPLLPFRLGRNVFRTERVLSEEERAIASARLAKARNSSCSNKFGDNNDSKEAKVSPNICSKEPITTDTEKVVKRKVITKKTQK